MISSELQTYVQKRRAQGANDAGIEEELRKAGWKDKDIHENLGLNGKKAFARKGWILALILIVFLSVIGTASAGWFYYSKNLPSQEKPKEKQSVSAGPNIVTSEKRERHFSQETWGLDIGLGKNRRILRIPKIAWYEPANNNFSVGDILDIPEYPDLQFALTDDEHNAVFIVEFQDIDPEQAELEEYYSTTIQLLEKETALGVVVGGDQIDKQAKPVFVHIAQTSNKQYPIQGYIAFARQPGRKSVSFSGLPSEEQTTISYKFQIIELLTPKIGLVSSSGDYDILAQVKSPQDAEDVLNTFAYTVFPYEINEIVNPTQLSRTSKEFTIEDFAQITYSLAENDNNCITYASSYTKQPISRLPENNEVLEFLEAYFLESCKTQLVFYVRGMQELEAVHQIGYSDIEMFKKRFEELTKYITDLTIEHETQEIKRTDTFIIGLQKLEQKYDINLIDIFFNRPE